MDGALAVLPHHDGTVIRIVLAGKPTAWQRDGRRIITPRDKTKKQFVSTYTHTETRSQQADLKQMAFDQMAGRAPFTGPIDLRYGAFIPVPPSWSNAKRRRAMADEIRPTPRPDFDNLMKMVDALKGVVWVDDAQATDVFFWKRYTDRPRVVIEIRPIDLTRQRFLT
jgi:Holliday junction resolvase RusA-like endonuclease